MLLFTILKVIGLVLLFLLLLILLLLALVLLVPIRYAGAGHKGEEKSDYAAHVDVRWLFRIVQLHAGLTPAGLAYYLRILCFHPIDSRPPDTPPTNGSDESSSQSEEEPSTEGSVANASDESLSQSEEEPSTEGPGVNASDETSSRCDESASSDDAVAHSSDEISAESEEEVPSTDGTETDASCETSSRQTEENMQDAYDGAKCRSEDVEVDSIELKNAAEAPKKKKRKKTSIADRIKRICEKASSLREAVEDEENQKVFRLLLTRVKYLLHHLRFRKFEGRLTFGFDDPATVGRMLGVLSLFYPLYGENFTITPVFDHSVFEGEIALKGHVRLIHILIAAIQLMMNKKIRGLVLDRI